MACFIRDWKMVVILATQSGEAGVEEMRGASEKNMIKMKYWYVQVEIGFPRSYNNIFFFILCYLSPKLQYDRSNSFSSF